jgi:OmcA/MtrC family decaheme c-type cytochrome
MKIAGARGITRSRVPLIAMLALAATIGLAGCEGDRGETTGGPSGPADPIGPTGPTGPTVPPTVGIEDGGPVTIGNGSTLTAGQIEAIGGLVATLDSAAVANDRVVIQFTVKTSHGGPVLELAATTLRLGIAKLVPPFGGLPSRWQSYINRNATPGNTTAGFVPVLPSAIQANTESGTAAGWQELGNGVYRYTSATNLATVTSPIAVAYEPSLTHRASIAIDLSGAAARQLAPDNPFRDFVPAGGDVTANKLIADTKNCADCHVRFAEHGGPRRSNEYCVVCHNPASIDPDGGESVDFAYMAHSIHRGVDRNNAYIVYGFNGTQYDFGDVTYPQSTLFCETCHTQSAAAPQGDDWLSNPSAASCGGCHDAGLARSGPDAATGRYTYTYEHTSPLVVGPVPDGSCVDCHRDAGAAGSILEAHRQGPRLQKELGEQFVFSVLSVGNVGLDKVPSITFKVAKPDGTPYDLATDPAFSLTGASLNLYFAWDTKDVSNADPATGKTPAGERGAAYRMRIADIKAYAVKNADGTYTTDLKTAAVPAGIALPVETQSAMVVMDGHPMVLVDGAPVQARARNAVGYFGTPRARLVTEAQCNDCHEQLQLHGGNRNGDPQGCLVCHNSSGAFADEPDIAGTIAMGAMIHNIHVGKMPLFLDITYPQSLANCEACHLPGSYNVARTAALPISTGPGADPTSYTDDTWSSATAGTCGTCHDSVDASAHMTQNGGVFDVVGGKTLTPSSSTEACVVCHGVGRPLDTAKVHGN